MRTLLALATLAACDATTAPPSAPAPASGRPDRATAPLPPEVALQLAPYRPDDRDGDALFQFEPGHDIETFDGALVRVHFTRTGPDAVKVADSDGSGVPDTVEAAASVYDEVLEFYAGLGFRPPLSDLGISTGDGGDGRLDVYLVDFAGASDGAWVRERCGAGPAPRSQCSGYVVQENDFTGYGYPSYRVASRILSSHELFHAVQAAYDADQGANWSEATAVWASERFDPSLEDLEGFAGGYLDKTDRTIDQDPVGPVDAFSYGLAIFPQYLDERFGDGLLLDLWEALEDGAGGVADPHWLTALAALLEEDYDARFADAWPEFATWCLRAGWGASGGPTFASAEDLPAVKRETAALPFSDDKLRVYPASFQVWSMKRSGPLAAAIVSTADGDTDGLVLVTATRKGGKVISTIADGLDAELDGTSTDEVLVAVVNTNLEGNSKRPGLCLGTPPDVAACKATLAPVAEPAEASPEAVEDDAEASEPGPEPVDEVEVVEVVESETADASDATEPIGAGDVAETAGGRDDGCDAGGATALVGALALALRRRRQRR